MVFERLGTHFMAVGQSRKVPLIENSIHGKYMENIPHTRRPL